MSGNFLPDLANWALRGGAADQDGNDDDDGEVQQQTSQQEPMTENEIRAKRLARLAALDGVSSKNKNDQDVKMTNVDSSPSPMDIDEKPAPVVVASKPPPSAKDVIEPKPKKKRAKEPLSADDLARKQRRKKELLIKKILQVTLKGGSVTDPASVKIDIDDNNVVVQNVAEILAARLSISTDSPSLDTIPPQKKGLITYLGACHKRASEELKSLRQAQEKKKSTTTGIAELEQILDEVKRQVVSYAASSLLEPDLFEMGKNGASQLAQCLIDGTTDPAVSITFGVSGPTTSFYSCLCDELINLDTDLFGNVIAKVAESLSTSMSKFTTILDGGSQSNGAGPLSIVAAIAALCSNKKAAIHLTKIPNFLLPEAGTDKAAEKIVPPIPQLPAGSSAQQQRFFRMMTAMSHGRSGYLRRSGPALEKDTLLGLVLRLGLPYDNPTVTGSFQNAASRTVSDINKVTNGMRSQLKAYQTAVNSLIRTLITAGADARNQVS